MPVPTGPDPLGRPLLPGLLVDDEPLVVSFTRCALERAGRPVLVAESGEEALELARRHEGELAWAIVDVGLPGLDGHATLRELRALRPGLPVLLTSGDPGERGGDAGFLPKPYDAPALLAALAALPGVEPHPVRGAPARDGSGRDGSGRGGPGRGGPGIASA